mmetsp:Transcript_12925/g.19103  ORF Transcript_12925/g.19103 Transcript_12925/m.19103 type:complete len:466 (+) Transcript_12925:2-1399(+)
MTKVEISGGGRCNVMHDATMALPQILSSYPRGQRELHGLYAKHFTPQNMKSWFTSRGVALKTEQDSYPMLLQWHIHRVRAIVKSIVAPPIHGDVGAAATTANSDSILSSAYPPPPVTITYEQPTTEQNDTKKPQQQQKITTNLLVAADGGQSFVRRTLGMPTVNFGYNRRAVTCTVEIETSMNYTAHQRFMPNGPIALLPIWNEDGSDDGDEDEETKLYANIVWSTTPSEAQKFQNMSNEEFVTALNNELQKGPTNNPPLIPPSIASSLPTPLANLTHGMEMVAQTLNNSITMSQWSERKPFQVPPLINKVVGRKFGFDLNLMQAQSYVRPRVALVGDAAHTIHPMAGQGLNLGLGDARCLANVVKEAVDSGMDAGDTMHFLNKYDAERKVEVTSMMGGIQLLHGFFSSTFEPLVYVRSLGMNIINSVGVVRKRLVEVAVGANGITTGASKDVRDCFENVKREVN